MNWVECIKNFELLKYMKKKKLPVIPTEFIESFEINGIKMTPGWYGVKIGNDGLESMYGTETHYKEFSDCKTACDIHNQFLGMSITDIARLYAQQRGNSILVW
jgi:hypothetical protein